MKILAFGHKSDTGKDTAAGFAFRQLRITRPDLNVQKIEFARPLKQMTYYLYRWTGIHEPQYYEDNREAREHIIPALGINIVQLWCKVGDAVRSIADETFVHAALDCSCDVLVISDVRFMTEINALRKHDAVLVKVSRDAAIKRTTNADNELNDFDGWDHVIENNGSLQELHDKIEAIVNVIP